MVRTISYMEYCFLPKNRRTPLSDYYADEAENSGGRIYGLFSENVMNSFLILCIESTVGVISYIETDEKYRCKGYATELIKAVMSEKDIVYSIHILSSNPEYDAVMAVIRKSGFYAYNRSTVFTYKTGDAMWSRMDAIPFVRMRKMLLTKGGKCISFRELSQDERSCLSRSNTNEFHNTMNPGEFLTNSARALDWELSFAMFEGAELKAYSLVTRPSKNHVIVEQIASADHVRGAGFIVVPLSMTLEKVREITEIEKMSMAIDDSNTASRSFLFSILKGVDVKKEKNIFCYYKKR